MTAPLDLDALEAAARAAGGGEWFAQDQHADNGQFSYVEITDQDGNEISGEEVGPNADKSRFMVAANPAVVLELIARLRVAETTIQRMTAATFDDAETIDRLEQQMTAAVAMPLTSLLVMNATRDGVSLSDLLMAHFHALVAPGEGVYVAPVPQAALKGGA